MIKRNTIYNLGAGDVLDFEYFFRVRGARIVIGLRFARGVGGARGWWADSNGWQGLLVQTCLQLGPTNMNMHVFVRSLGSPLPSLCVHVHA